MESIQDCLSKHSHDDADIQALLDSIDIFRRNHCATKYSPSHEQKEQDEADEDQDDGIDLDDGDTWSDELSEHDSDRDFIAPSDEEDKDASYEPSESEAEDTEDTEDMDLPCNEEDKENEVKSKATNVIIAEAINEAIVQCRGDTHIQLVCDVESSDTESD
jgi:TATA-binding protein-associated factor Taf7